MARCVSFWQEQMKDNEEWVATMMRYFGTTLKPREVDLREATNDREMAKVLRELAKSLSTEFEEYT